MPANVLVADDEPDLLFMLAFTLRQLGGHSIMEARDGQEALELARRQRPDLMVLDVQMPRMTGYDVCRHVRADAALLDVPVILLSAKGQSSEIEEGNSAGATAYLLKPYAPQDLVAVVGQLLNDAV